MAKLLRIGELTGSIVNVLIEARVDSQLMHGQMSETSRVSYHSGFHRSWGFVLGIVRDVWRTMEVFVNAVAGVCPHNATPIFLGDRFSEDEEDQP